MEPSLRWARALEKIKPQVSAQMFTIWFQREEIHLLEVREQVARLRVPNRYFSDWIKENYEPLILEALGDDVKALAFEVTQVEASRSVEPAPRDLAREAGIPVIHRGYTLRRQMEIRHGESRERFLDRLFAADPPRLGVVPWNRGILHRAEKWQSPESLYLSGPPGTGKSLVCDCILADLLTRQREAVLLRTSETILHRAFRAIHGKGRILYGAEGRRDAQAKVMAEEHVHKAMTADVLMLDDIGVDPQAPWTRLVDQVIEARCEGALPILFTSNLPLVSDTQESLADHRPHRILDRIGQMCGGTFTHLEAVEGVAPWSWRGIR